MGESDYPTDNAFVEAFLYEKKNWIFFPFFFILKERMFFLSLDKRAGLKDSLVWVKHIPLHGVL
jgi:hypothetical protein